MKASLDEQIVDEMDFAERLTLIAELAHARALLIAERRLSKERGRIAERMKKAMANIGLALMNEPPPDGGRHILPFRAAG